MFTTDVCGISSGSTDLGTIAMVIGAAIWLVGIVYRANSGWVGFAGLAIVDLILILALLSARFRVLDRDEYEYAPALILLTIHFICITTSAIWSLRVASQPTADVVDRAKAAEAGRGVASISVALLVAVFFAMLGLTPGVSSLFDTFQGAAITALSLGALVLVMAGGYTKYLEAWANLTRARKAFPWALLKVDHAIMAVVWRVLAARGPQTADDLVRIVKRALGDEYGKVRLKTAAFDRLLRHVAVVSFTRGPFNGKQLWQTIDGRWMTDAAVWPTDARLRQEVAALLLIRAGTHQAPRNNDAEASLDATVNSDDENDWPLFTRAEMHEILNLAHGGRPNRYTIGRHPLVIDVTPANARWWWSFSSKRQGQHRWRIAVPRVEA